MNWLKTATLLLIALGAVSCAESDCRMQAEAACEEIHPERIGESWNSCILTQETACEAGGEL